MRINIVSVEDSLISLGVRKVSAYVRRVNPDNKIFCVPLTNFFSLWSLLRRRYSNGLDPQRDVPPMAAGAILAIRLHAEGRRAATLRWCRRLAIPALLML